MKSKLFLGLGLGILPQITSAAILTVTTAQNYLPDGTTVAPGSFLEALQLAGPGDTIKFSIPGSGPHVIATPQQGYPLLTINNLTIDGYSQPGASANTNPILGGNNAHLKIVLDSSAGPEQRTRLGSLNNPGFGDSESAILGLLGAKNFTLNGVSFLSRQTDGSDTDPDIYCVALINDSTNARLQGCWFGLAPDGATVSGGRSAVASFIGDGGTASSGLIFGTDGNGVNDLAEFNLTLGMVLAINLETPSTKISGNYINVFPNGVTFFDINSLGGELESIENGQGDNMVIGTDGDGVSDANERNIIAHSVYPRTIEFWGAHATNVVIAGNYFGVGVDGHTAAPLPTGVAPDFVQLKNRGSIRIGSNGDGVSDTLEGNLFYNIPGDRFLDATGDQSGDNLTKSVVRRNQFSHCNFPAIPFADSVVSYAGYYASVVSDSSMAVPVLQQVSGGVLKGSFAPPNPANYSATIIDLYSVDRPGLTNRLYWPRPLVHSSSWLGGYKDNGPFDLDPAPNQFSIDLSGLGLSPGTYLAVAITYAKADRLFNPEVAVTSPLSLPVAPNPTLLISYSQGDTQVELSWIAPSGAFTPQVNSVVNSPDWFELFGANYSDGRNVQSVAVDPLFDSQFYRLISQ